MECDKSMFVFFTLLYILVIILTSSVIREGESEKKNGKLDTLCIWYNFWYCCN